MPDADRAGHGAVFFLTDYGHADEFAGVVRAVVTRLAPGAPIVDVTHGVASFDVRAGALALVRCAPHLGPGILVGIVDPGVGSSRRALAVEVAGTGPRFVLGPDNGLLPWALDALGGARRAVELPSAGSTFDGRDVFAPAAAALWRGEPLDDLGPAVDLDALVRLPPARLLVGEGMVDAEVLWVDRFGNAQLAAAPADASRAGLGPVVELVLDAGRSHPARMAASFAALGDDEIGVVEDANGMLALVCNRAPAATVLDVRPGDMVGLRAGGSGGTVIGRIQPGGRP
ncbi:MAG TPA: SAM-dependent chlorinase/fluorinase [Acidimicrobiales bacterium]|nr:SAM-dependent chlorinase/fluorinase [Acidimicrobiales bacterium]